MYTAQECADIAGGLRKLIDAWSVDWLAATPLRIAFRNVGGAEDAVLLNLQLSQAAADEIVGIYTEQGAVLTAPATTLAQKYLDEVVGIDNLERQPDDAMTLDSALAEKMAIEGLADLAARLSPIDSDPHEFAAPANLTARAIGRLFVRGSGSGVLTISYAEFDIEYLVGAARVAAYVEPVQVAEAGALAPIMPALVDERMELEAHIGSTVVTIGELERLAVGDVVKLDQSIETSPKLLTRGGEPVVNGRLGNSKGHKALQVY
jgi:flagellar motor switch/type III secretory pathway protein FliN